MRRFISIMMKVQFSHCYHLHTDKSVLAAQGCYKDQEATHDLPFEVTGKIAHVTINTCLSTCLAAGYLFAGVQVSAYGYGDMFFLFKNSDRCPFTSGTRLADQSADRSALGSSRKLTESQLKIINFVCNLCGQLQQLKGLSTAFCRIKLAHNSSHAGTPVPWSSRL